MQTTKMSITRALSLLKAQKAEAETFLRGQNVFMGITTGENGKETSVVGMDVKGLESHIQGRWDKIQGLLKRQVIIKDAINKSNHATFVTVNGRQVTVAEAILIKANLPLQKLLLQSLQKAHLETTQAFNKVKAAVDQRVDAMVNNSITETTADEVKVAIAAQVRATQDAMLAPKVVDPLDLTKRIVDLEAEITFVTNELDFVLSESNTTTTIDVEM